jgi:hypothetical protein
VKEAKARRVKPQAPTQALAAAVLLIGYLADQQPGGKIARLSEAERVRKAEEWSDQVRLLNERDGVAYPDIEAMIHWSQRDPFWSGVVLSTAALRGQWDKMAAQRQRGSALARGTRPDNPTVGRADPVAHDDHEDGDVAL